MTKERLPWLTAFTILFWCLVQSYEMFIAWRQAPFERASWLLWLVWIVPILYFWIILPEDVKSEVIPNAYLQFIALGCVLLGQMGSLNAIKYVGLACAFASFMPWKMLYIPWLAGSLAWMPVAGWLSSHWPFWIGYAIRLAVIAAVVFWVLLDLKKYQKGI
jgi:hypothetical protein